MTRYTTLGEGRKTAVLSAAANGTQRTVTSLAHEQARPVADRLDTLFATIPNALFDVAAAYDGRPAHARRRLLAHYDATVVSGRDGTPVPELDTAWRLAADQVSTLAALVATEPAAVIAAVRRELAEVILSDLDGVLISAVLVPQVLRPKTFLRLVLNQYVGASTVGDQSVDLLFDGLDVECLLTISTIGGCPYGDHIADQTWVVIGEMRDLRSSHRDEYAEVNAPSIFAESGDEYPCLMTNPHQLRAWMAEARPDLLERFPELSQDVPA